MSSPMSQVPFTKPFPPLPLSQSPTPIAVCATTLLYDYALTLGEEVRIICSPFLTKPPDHPHLLPQIARMWSSVTPVFTLTRSILILHSLRLSIPKCLFLINRYIVLPMLVCVFDIAPFIHTSNYIPALTGSASLPSIRLQPLSFSPSPPASSRTHLPENVCSLHEPRSPLMLNPG